MLTNFVTMSRDLLGLKSLTRVLRAEAMVAETEKRPADAARSYADSIRLGIEMIGAGSCINRLVGVACQEIGSVPLIKLLPQLTCEQLRPLVAELERSESKTVSWPELARNENRFARTQLGNYPNPIKLVTDLWKARNAGNVPNYGTTGSRNCDCSSRN